MSLAVGIDLGTTNSALACVDEHGRPVIVPNLLGESTTPSVLCFGTGEVVIGREAKELQAAGTSGVAAFFKRQMGDSCFMLRAAGKQLSATDLSALLLARIREDAEAVLGQPITQAVITVPAYFRNPQREATIAAGRQAGLEVLQVINEPTAAAVAYGFGSRAGALDRGAGERTLVVYDLGGGTFDVTVLSLGQEGIQILTSGGDHELGGKDWDDRLVELLASRFEAEHGSDPFADVESLADLLVRAEEAKKRLSTAQSAEIAIVHDGCRGRYTIDRATFEEVTADLMERTVALTNAVLAEIGLATPQIDGVLLVGGSTRMPMVTEFIQRHLGHQPMPGVHVDEAVALGAAITAAERLAEMQGARPRLVGAVRTVDVTNHSLGMIAMNADRSAYLSSIILPKNRPIPCVEVRPYQHRTRLGADNRLEIFMTQGESESPAEVSYLGKYVLHDVPHASGTEVIEISYRYDASGTVEVSGRVRGTSDALPLTVEPLPDDVPARFLRPPEIQTELVHVTAYLAFDLSGSMHGEPLAEAQKAARSFIENVDLGQCSIGIIAFAESVAVKLKATQNGKRIHRAIKELTVGEVGICSEADPFDQAHRLLDRVDGPRFVITLADGVWANQSRAVKRAQQCVADGIESIAIGFGGADEAFLRRIASCDQASFLTSLGGLVETFTGIAQVLTSTGGGLLGPDAATGSAPAETGRGSFLSLLRSRLGSVQG